MILAVMKAIFNNCPKDEVMGSNPVEVEKFSGFSTQLLKLHS